MEDRAWFGAILRDVFNEIFFEYRGSRAQRVMSDTVVMDMGVSHVLTFSSTPL